MAKKMTQHWNGYRGNGKPVIPCVPECLVEKGEIDNSGTHLVRIPTDRNSRAEPVPAAQRKELRRLYKLLVLPDPPMTGLHDYMSAPIRDGRARTEAARRARKANDLDMMRALAANREKHETKDIVDVVCVIRETGHASAAEIITQDHFSHFKELANLVTIFSPFDRYMHKRRLSQNIWDVALVAFSSDENQKMVLDIIAQREITDAEVIRRLVDEMRGTTVSLSSGLL